jgi:hypothetical protein
MFRAKMKPKEAGGILKRARGISETGAPRIKARHSAGMSDFFANLGGFRMPDVRMNQGPLPSVAGGPVGSDGTPDGVINGSDSLLGNIEPYAYGESARAGSDSNYQQIPHRAQYIVLPLHLPSQLNDSVLRVSHAVDNGDLAFVLMTRGRRWFAPGEQVASSVPVSLPLFANLEVVNYILACMQLAEGAPVAHKTSWAAIRAHLWKGAYDESKCGDDEARRQHLFDCVQYSVQNLFKPHGICAGSEKQGGQHEETWAPVQAAVNYTTTMTVDGQNRDLVNYWHKQHICAGDRLTMVLELRNRGNKEGQTHEYELTSYYKRPVSATIRSNRSYWQLVPHILHSDPSACTDPQDHRVNGYWHIAQSFQGRRGFASGASRHGGAPLHVTFAPVFMQCGDGPRESPYFLQGLMDEIKDEMLRTIWKDYSQAEAGYEALSFQVMLRACGVSAKTIQLVFEKHETFVTRWLANDEARRDRQSRTKTFSAILGLYKFAKSKHNNSAMTAVLKLLHITFQGHMNDNVWWTVEMNDAVNKRFAKDNAGWLIIAEFNPFLGNLLGVDGEVDEEEVHQNVFARMPAMGLGACLGVDGGLRVDAGGAEEAASVLAVKEKVQGKSVRKKCAALLAVAE